MLKLLYLKIVFPKKLNCHCLQKVILYTEDPKDANKKLLVLITEFSKGAGYKINTQKIC